MKRLRYANTGFTLIELMVVVAIVGVLTLIAYPSYQSYMIKANRAQAQSYLMDVAQKQQLFFNDSRTYAADEAALDSTAPERVDDNYDVSFDLATISPVPRFRIIAIPKAGTRQVSDGTLSIDNTGEKLRGSEPW